MSDTHRSDEAEEQSIRAYENQREVGWPPFPCDGYDFSRELERELNAALARIKRLEEADIELADRMTAEAHQFNLCAKNHGGKNRGAQAVADRAAEMLLRFASQAKEAKP